MNEVKKRKVHLSYYKARVALEAVRGVKTIHQIAEQFGLHSSQIDRWKQVILTGANTLFNDSKPGPKPGHEGIESDDGVWGSRCSGKFMFSRA